MRRFLYHMQRFSGEIKAIMFTLSLFLFMIVAFYPGDEGIEGYIELVKGVEGFSSLFGQSLLFLGYKFWVALQFTTYNYYITAVGAIYMGSKVLPTREKDGSEIFTGGSSMGIRRFYIENYLAAVVGFIVATIPGIAIMVGGAIFWGYSEFVDEVLLSYIFVWMISITLISLTSFFTAFRFSRKAGLAAGFGYFIYAFMIDLAAPSNPDLQDYQDISIATYASPVEGLVTGEYDFTPVHVLLAVSASLVLTGWLLVQRKEFIESSGSSRSIEFERLLPQSLQRKFPIFVEQVRNDIAFITIYSLFMALFLLMIGSVYPGGELAISAVEGFDSPFITGMLRGYSPTPDYIGFLSYEYFSIPSLYMGLFVAAIATAIPNRDARRDEADVLWGNPRRVENVIVVRTVAMIVEFTFLWLVFVLFLPSSNSRISTEYGEPGISFEQAFSFLLPAYFHFVAFGVFIMGVSMLLGVAKGRKLSLWLYGFMAVGVVFAYGSPELELLRYLSFFNAYDGVGLALGKVETMESLLLQIPMLLFSLVVYLSGLRKISRSDLI